MSFSLCQSGSTAWYHPHASYLFCSSTSSRLRKVTSCAEMTTLASSLLPPPLLLARASASAAPSSVWGMGLPDRRATSSTRALSCRKASYHIISRVTSHRFAARQPQHWHSHTSHESNITFTLYNIIFHPPHSTHLPCLIIYGLLQGSLLTLVPADAGMHIVEVCRQTLPIYLRTTQGRLQAGAGGRSKREKRSQI